jgi:hypothetical protein
MAEPNYIKLLQEKRQECLVQAKAFEIWLEFLTPIRWTTIFISIIFPALAGFSLFQGTNIFGINWQHIAAVLTFTASVVAALHTALRCDSHQSACKKLAPLYFALADEFDIAGILDEKAAQKKYTELIKRLADLKRTTTETPIRWAKQKAEREVLFTAN